MKIKLKKAECFDNFYQIVRAEHEDISWAEHKDGVHFFMTSERLSPESSIEGDSWEMLEIAKAIKAKKDFISTRCAVNTDKEEKVFYLWSPRNSLYRTTITYEEGEEFANEVLKTLLNPEVQNDSNI